MKKLLFVLFCFVLSGLGLQAQEGLKIGFQVSPHLSFSSYTNSVSKKKEESITDSGPFDDHFDRIEILPAADVDLIITEEDYENPERKAFIKETIKNILEGDNRDTSMDGVQALA